MTADQLQRAIQELVDGQPNDERLRDHLEGLRRDENLPGLTWFWGPLLYRRNRVLFRSFIANHFSDFDRSGLRWKRIPWEKHADRLQPWLDAVQANRDTALTRRLMRWKFANAKGWGIDSDRWIATLLTAYRAASGPAARAVVLDEFDDWFQLTEDGALSLYQTDQACGEFLLKHLPSSFWSGEGKRQLWKRLRLAADAAGDAKLSERLYRKQVPITQWHDDVIALAKSTPDAGQLDDLLERRHPEGYGLKLGDTLVELLKLRGREVLPYVRRKLPDVLIRWAWWGNPSDPFVKLAEERQWWDLWAAAIRADRRPEPFNNAVKKLLNDGTLPEADRVERLRAVTGASREWNWPGFGFLQVHALKDEIAVRLYRQHPDLVRGPFKPHVTPTWWAGYPELLAAAQQASDDELVDLMASRYATRFKHESIRRRDADLDRLIDTANRLGDDYQTIRDRDQHEFARRAASVLTRIPAFSISGGYDQLLRSNKLARLLFVRSFEAFLSVPEAVRDLVEASDIHVQMLAYRVLAQDDDRARKLAVELLDILLGTLFRPLHRKTRLAAFEALANAARADAVAAQRVLRKAREAMRLPDKKYPKEQLIGLIGRILHGHVELRGQREQPVIYGLAEATRGEAATREGKA